MMNWIPAFAGMTTFQTKPAKKMKYRKIADTDLEVSTVALGTWAIGGDASWGASDDVVSISVIREAIDNGVNFIDTAPVYGSGHSEEIVGKAISGRKDVIIATKCGLEQKGPSIKHNLKAAFIREEIENSLRRLQVGTIDLYQCHWPDPSTPLEETFGVLKELITEGKVRYIGVSNFDKGLLEKVSDLFPVVSNQMQYSVFDRKIESELVPFCAEKNISILSYGPLGGGMLTGKYKKPPNFPNNDARSYLYKYYREPFWTKGRELLRTIEDIASKRAVPVAHVAINWVLAHPEVASCIVGCRTLDQLKANIGAADWILSKEELALIDTEYKRIFA